MSGFEEKLAKDLSQGQEYREAYAEAFANEYLASQIQVLRKQRGWTQAQLGERIGSNQGRVSVYEDEEYGKWSLDTLRKIAAALGLWVKIGFESYGTLVHEAAHFHPDRLSRADFDGDSDIRRWLELDAAPSPEEETRRRVAHWARETAPPVRPGALASRPGPSRIRRARAHAGSASLADDSGRRYGDLGCALAPDSGVAGRR